MYPCDKIEDKLEIDDSALYALFFRCSHILHRRLGARASRQSLLSLLEQNGAMTQKELRDALGIQAGSFSELALRLEERGFITRERDARDRRRIVLRLTDAGREKAGQSARVGDAELFAALSIGEQAQLRVMLGKIVEAHEAWKRERGIR